MLELKEDEQQSISFRISKEKLELLALLSRVENGGKPVGDHIRAAIDEYIEKNGERIRNICIICENNRRPNLPTSEQYRELVASKKCPKCSKRFEKEDMGMYGDRNGFRLADAGFPYTLWAYCGNCRKQFTFWELGIEEIKDSADPAKVLNFPAR